MSWLFHLPHPIPLHDKISLIHHAIVDVVGIVANVILFFCIVLRSPKSLRSYVVLLLTVNIVDFIAVVSEVLAMIRIIPAHWVLGYIYLGPCVYVSGNFCHAIYSLMLTTFSMSMMLMLTSFCFRLYVILRSSPSNSSVILICLAILVFNLLTITTVYSTLDDTEIVKQLMQELRPDYDLDSYVFAGHISMLSPRPLMTVLCIVLPSAPIMISIFFVRRKLLRAILESSIRMSVRTNLMHSILAKVLSRQSLLPFFFTGSAYCYATCQIDIMCSPFQEHFIFEFVAYMPTIAPMVTIYYIKPYREFVAGLISK